ncbi:MAG: undecaprenyl-phosphate glucose phosphotransferase [Gammaproteobacteria bacterium]|nr:MAG: undecaprenyl-phosphate glucose phosphotransferase [Gammaproteobacteria bacterium]
MTRYRGSHRVWLLLVLDMVGVVVLLYGWAYLKDGEIRDPYHLLGLVSLFVMTLIYNSMSTYRYPATSLGIAALTRSWFTVVLILIFYGFITKTTHIFSREILMEWVVSAYVLQLGNRYLVNLITRKRVEHRGTLARAPALLVGAGSLGRYLAAKINDNFWFDQKIIGVIDDDPELIQQWDLDGVTALDTKTDDIDKIIDDRHIRAIYIALPVSSSSCVEKIQSVALDKNIDIYWAPDIFSMTLINPSIREFAGVPLVALSESPLVGQSAMIKSIEDRVLASLALVLLSPLFLAVALAIKIESPGPVFFKQKRHGWDGAVFEIWKFRSMRQHDDNGVEQAKRDDPRVTRVGRFIRRTSIDELPQLFNVLGGSMSLVGPRPHATEHNEYFSGKIASYFTRHRIKPGMTGLAQISGYRGETETLDKMEGRLRFDLYYINNWSLPLDLEIMLRTVFTMFNKDVY